MNEILSSIELPALSDFVAFWLLLFVPSFFAWMLVGEVQSENRYADYINASRARR
jgi:ABC-type microcin C transport system permease subunit YejE